MSTQRTHSESGFTRRASNFAHFPYELRKALLKRAAGIKFAGAASYWQAPDISGEAFVCNMAGAQVMLKLARFIDPGKKIYLQLHCLTYKGMPFEMTGVVQWCRQLQGGEGLVAVATLVDDTAKTGEPLRDRPTEPSLSARDV